MSFRFASPEKLNRLREKIIRKLNQRGRSRLILFGGGIFDRFSGLSSTEGPAINDAGQVVFLAILADGRRGIFVAEPTTLPTQFP